MAIQTIGTDIQATTTTNTTSNAASGMSKFMNYLSMGTSVAGPVVSESLYAAGNTSGAAIASVTGNAVYGATSAAGSASYLSTGSLGSSYSGNAYYGGSGSYTTADYSSSSSTDVESILTDSAASNAYLIGIQSQIQQQAVVYQGVSNALKAKSDMERNSIQNLK